jgi:putative MATE family efflux protein
MSEVGADRGSLLRDLGAALRGETRDYTTGSIPRAVVLLAVPMVIEMAGESLFAITDAFFVARVGAAALATVGLTESMLAIVYSLAVGLSMGATAMVARRIGAREPRQASHVAAQAVTLGAAVALVLGVVGALAAPRLLGLMGADREVIETGSAYARTMLGGMVTIMLLFIINAVFRGAGDASMAMRSLWLANAINIVLDPCLILGLGPFPELGLTGAAVATNIGRGVGVLYQLRGLFGGRGRLDPRLADLRPDPPLMRKLVDIAWGGIGQNLIATASWIGLVRILALYGAATLAGYVIAIRVVVFAILPAWGVSNAAATLVGQNLGAERVDRAERSVWVTGFYNMLFLGSIGAAFLLGAEWIVGFFTPAGAVRDTAVRCLQVVSYGYPFYAWGMVAAQSFNGAGDTRTPTLIYLVSFWLLQIPLAWVLARSLGLGPDGVFWAISIAYSFSALLGVLLFRRGSWKTKVV